MKIHEHHARDIFKKYGLPVPEAEVANNPEEVKNIARGMTPPVVVKAQVLVGGRGKAGGVKIAENHDDAMDKSKDIFGLLIKGLRVEKVLVAEAVDIENEYYLGILLDRDKKKHCVIASTAGGVDIEQVAEETPELIGKTWVDPAYGLHPFEIRNMLFDAGFDPKLALKVTGILMKLYKVVIENDCSLAEINPLVQAKDGTLWAIDAKVNFDDSSLYRHPELKPLKESEETDPIEKEAHARGIAYVRLEDGNVGVIGNGAGLVMATMDEVKRFGKGIAKPANFLDIGGGAQADLVRSALELVTMDQNVKVILINVFGGITRCDEVAKGILQAIEEVDLKVPIIIRLAGTNEKEGRELLIYSGLEKYLDIKNAPYKVIESLEQAAPIILETIGVPAQ